MKRRIVSHQVNPADVNKQQFSTDQASVLDELSYLLSTEYEAVKWYDKAIPEIKASGLDPELVAELVQGIKEIRKDEEDHIAHIERLTNLVKGSAIAASRKFNEVTQSKIEADTVKKKNGKWVNRGDDGEEHGEFATKKKADAQRRAMYANGYKG